MKTHHDPLNEPWLLANSAGDPYDTPYRIVSEWEDGSYAHLEVYDLDHLLTELAYRLPEREHPRTNAPPLLKTVTIQKRKRPENGIRFR